jgi:hypothetical protein
MGLLHQQSRARARFSSNTATMLITSAWHGKVVGLTCMLVTPQPFALLVILGQGLGGVLQCHHMLLYSMALFWRCSISRLWMQW